MTVVDHPTGYEPVKVKGMFRVQLEENGEVVGDSGWHNNLITTAGRQNYLVNVVGQLSGSSFVGYLGIGTGTSPAAGDTSLSGEVYKRAAVTASSSSNSSAVQFAGTFNSSQSFVTSTLNLSNIGLFASSSGGTLFAENTFASSACASNQNVNVSYVISFS